MLSLAQLPADVLVTQVSNGLLLLVLGMGTVFVFLAILVAVTKIMSGLVRKSELRKPVTETESSAARIESSTAQEAEVAVALAAAFAKSGK